MPTLQYKPIKKSIMDNRERHLTAFMAVAFELARRCGANEEPMNEEEFRKLYNQTYDETYGLPGKPKRKMKKREELSEDGKTVEGISGLARQLGLTYLETTQLIRKGVLKEATLPKIYGNYNRFDLEKAKKLTAEYRRNKNKLTI